MTTSRKNTKSPKPKKPQKDPNGGLTAAGRAEFKKRDGSNLRPGVTKAESAMTPEEMRRKGSFLRRHYARKEPFPLIDAKGEPTRYALQAHAWGEKVPKSAADVKKLAAKGSRLIERGKTARKKYNGATTA